MMYMEFYNRSACPLCKIKAYLRYAWFILGLYLPRLRSFKIWRVYYLGSDDKEFISWNIIGKQWWVRPFSKPLYPESRYLHVKMVDRATLCEMGAA